MMSRTVQRSSVTMACRWIDDKDDKQKSAEQLEEKSSNVPSWHGQCLRSPGPIQTMSENFLPSIWKPWQTHIFTG